MLIADEPTTALDVTVQAQIMQLLQDLQEERKMGLILITHDLGVVADVADRIAVMYAGRIVEQGDIFDLYAAPAHPYTKGLLESIPRLDQKGQQLAAIGGLPPNLTRIPPGARSTPGAGTPRTSAGRPAATAARGRPRRWSACHFAESVMAGEPRSPTRWIPWWTTEDYVETVERGQAGRGADTGIDPGGVPPRYWRSAWRAVMHHDR